MKYIVIDEKNLGLSISDSEPKSGFLIPITSSRIDVLERNFFGMIYFSVIYPYVYDEDRAKGISTPKAYCLVEPDPWLIALAGIMWQGLIQGFTWDMIKTSALKGIEFLRSKYLLAKEPYPRDGWKKSLEKKKAGLEIGIAWTQFSEDGEPLHKLFLGIKREFNKKSVKERESIKHHHDQKYPR